MARDGSRLPSSQSFPKGKEEIPFPLAGEDVRGRENLKFAGGSPAAGYFFLCRQEKVTKKKATPVCRPSGALSFERKSGAAQLAPQGSNSACPLLRFLFQNLGGAQGILKSGRRGYDFKSSLPLGERVGVRGKLNDPTIAHHLDHRPRHAQQRGICANVA